MLPRQRKELTLKYLREYVLYNNNDIFKIFDMSVDLEMMTVWLRTCAMRLHDAHVTVGWSHNSAAKNSIQESERYGHV
jgi:hypothetical protein